jgi:hypothetical protein
VDGVDENCAKKKRRQPSAIRSRSGTEGVCPWAWASELARESCQGKGGAQDPANGPAHAGAQTTSVVERAAESSDRAWSSRARHRREGFLAGRRSRGDRPRLWYECGALDEDREAASIARTENGPISAVVFLFSFSMAVTIGSRSRTHVLSWIRTEPSLT